MSPPSPVEISHKKDGRQRRPHRFHVSCPLPTQPLDPMLIVYRSKQPLTRNLSFSKMLGLSVHKESNGIEKIQVLLCNTI